MEKCAKNEPRKWAEKRARFQVGALGKQKRRRSATHFQAVFRHLRERTTALCDLTVAKCEKGNNRIKSLSPSKLCAQHSWETFAVCTAHPLPRWRSLGALLRSRGLLARSPSATVRGPALRGWRSVKLRQAAMSLRACFKDNKTPNLMQADATLDSQPRQCSPWHTDGEELKNSRAGLTAVCPIVALP